MHLRILNRAIAVLRMAPVYECYFPKTRQYWNGWAMPVGLTPDSLVDFFEAALTGNKTEADYELCFELLTSVKEEIILPRILGW